VTKTLRGRVTARRVLKHAYETTRNLPDRLLHKRRHDAVVRRLSRGDRPRRILVVCHGNICRSPYLEAVLQRALTGTEVSSAGFVGRGRAVPQIAISLGYKRGLDLSGHRSRPLTTPTVRSADLVIVMDADQAHNLARMFPIERARIVIAGDLDPRSGANRGITDPWNRSGDVFESSFDRLDRCAHTLATILRPSAQR
jgi:protein-tyrosine phosphatase